MARITVEDCLEKVTNRFALVVLASKRTKELLSGSPRLVDASYNKEVVLSLREIADGQVRFSTLEEEHRISSLSAEQAQDSAESPSSELDELEKLFNDSALSV